MKRNPLLLFVTLIAISSLSAQTRRPISEGTLTTIREGTLQAVCPLERTEVKADISGFLARVTVTQKFKNLLPEKIEAVYQFPLPHDAAVDDMQMRIGDRTVKGAIKRREEARAIYEAARNSGRRAALLDQERPNIFTQHVANILPGDEVLITIRYVEHLPYDDGAYSFIFPMVVGPRYVPKGTEDTSLRPNITPKGTRAGHDVTVEVTLDAGTPLEFVDSPTHAVDVSRPATTRASAKLKNLAAIPNKDFVLRYGVAGSKIQDSLLTHRDSRGGFFTLVLTPPEKVAPAEITPKELVFVVDTSGSMRGFPLETAKKLMRMALDGLNPRDTFNVITFSGDHHILFDKPVPATRENILAARQFMDSRQGSGGTEMMKAVRAALDPSDSQQHMRIAVFITDGLVGNDDQIIYEIQSHANARVFAFGIGSATNRYLLDSMSRQGRGETQYVRLDDDGAKAAEQFYERVHAPLLTDIAIEWNGLPVADVYPSRIPDLFAAKPLVMTGRYTAAARGSVRLRGKLAGREFTREIAVNFPDAEPRHEVLATLWARARVASLTLDRRKSNREEVTQLGLDYRLMTPYTSFVAVEEIAVTEGGVPRRIEVPIEMPEGISYEGIFGEEKVAYGAGSVQAFSPPILSAQRAGVDLIRTRNPIITDPVRKIDPALTGLAGATAVSVQIHLTAVNAEIVAKLKELGAEILAQPKSGRLVIARLAASKLTEAAKLNEVVWIAALVKSSR